MFEVTTVRYRQTTMPNGDIRISEYNGKYVVVDGGIVMLFSDSSQTFIPYSQIERIDQTILVDNENESGVRMEKSLVSRHRRK